MLSACDPLSVPLQMVHSRQNMYKKKGFDDSIDDLFTLRNNNSNGGTSLFKATLN